MKNINLNLVLFDLDICPQVWCGAPRWGRGMTRAGCSPPPSPRCCCWPGPPSLPRSRCRARVQLYQLYQLCQLCQVCGDRELGHMVIEISDNICTSLIPNIHHEPRLTSQNIKLNGHFIKKYIVYLKIPNGWKIFIYRYHLELPNEANILTHATGHLFDLNICCWGSSVTIKTFPLFCSFS